MNTSRKHLNERKSKSTFPGYLGLVAIVVTITVFFYGYRSDEISPASENSNFSVETGRKVEPPADNPSGPQAIAAWTKPEMPEGFDSALEAATAQSDPGRRAEALQRWADAVGTASMESVLTRLEAIPDSRLRNEVRGMLLSSWAERDLAGMANWFGQHNLGDVLHQQARESFLVAFDERDPVAMVSWMERKLPESVRTELYGPFFQQWARTDPAAAASKLRQMYDAAPASSTPWNDLIGQVVAVWAQADLKGALAWIQALPPGTIKSQALAEASYRWTETAPQAAAAYAASQQDPSLLKLVAGKWAENDPHSATIWAARLPTGDEQDEAVISAAVTWGQKDPAAAATWAAGLPAESVRSEAVVSVVSAWAQTSPTQAATWIAQLPESSVRAQAASQLISAWAGKDATAAGQWLNTFPQSSSRDNAIASYDNAVSIHSTALATTSPALAFQSAGTIANETLRNHSLQEIATAWLSQDPVAARQKIVQSSLPTGIKSQLLESAVSSR